MADENLNYEIVRGLRRRLPDIDLITFRETEMPGILDPELLAWAADHQRILVTHDVTTITKFAYDRISAGEPLAGVFIIAATLPVSIAIEQIILHNECSDAGEWLDTVHYLPI